MARLRGRHNPPAVASGEPLAAERGRAGHDQFFGHPRGLSTLFLTEMWERFSYYGIRPLLVLFMSAALAEGGFGFERADASAIVGKEMPRLFAGTTATLLVAAAVLAILIVPVRRMVTETPASRVAAGP